MKTSIIVILKLYKKFVSPIFQSFFGQACVYTPNSLSCGDYAIKAVEKYGVITGLGKTALRLATCNPLTKSDNPKIIHI
ncbi:membrane protein insertion efficiency factor YidD [Candidatus Woesebacteria bacterium]|nr:MAG: membrane protein insertion efficiency factor YidD [Candidatus Woesebacteria bacterium]